MATPTPGKHPPVAATPPVSTPFSHIQAPSSAFSPRGPRSVVPSPQQFKKSPANSQTIYGHPSTSSFGAINFDSPTAAALAGMPLDINGLNGMGMGHDVNAEAGLGLGLGVNIGGGMGNSSLGVNVSGRIVDSEEEKKKKLQEVIDILSQNKGRVSEEGVERLARRTGLECLWEDGMGVGGGLRTLIIAGTGLSIDIDFQNNMVGKVALSFPDSPEMVTKHAEGAGSILLRDLQLKEGESPLTKMLDKFSINLERLATLDKLSILPNLNCYEAIAGIYESLRRIHEWEIKRMKEKTEMAGKSDEQIMKAVLCTRSGRPIFNARGQVGLSIDYWQEHRRTESTGQNIGDESDQPKTWSMVIECAQSSAMTFPSIRVTDKWISKEVEKQNPTTEDLLSATTGDTFDWQTPDNVILPTSDTNKNESQLDGLGDLNSNQKLPDVMFVAKFNPPLVVNYTTASNIHMATGTVMDNAQLSMFDNLLFPPSDNEGPEADGALRRIRTVRTVPTFAKSGEKINRTHNCTLTIHKADYGYKVSQLPFSHPRQLIELLPQLRLYARLSSLLDSSFTLGKTQKSSDSSSDDDSAVEDDFAAFMAKAVVLGGGQSSENMDVDVSLYTSGSMPHMRVAFPFRDYIADVWFDIAMNGVLRTTSENVLGAEGDGKGAKKAQPKDLGKMLESLQDFGSFAEYIRSRFA